MNSVAIKRAITQQVLFRALQLKQKPEMIPVFKKVQVQQRRQTGGLAISVMPTVGHDRRSEKPRGCLCAEVRHLTQPRSWGR